MNRGSPAPEPPIQSSQGLGGWEGLSRSPMGTFPPDSGCGRGRTTGVGGATSDLGLSEEPVASILGAERQPREKQQLARSHTAILTLVQGLPRKLGGVETVVLHTSFPTWCPLTPLIMPGLNERILFGLREKFRGQGRLCWVTKRLESDCSDLPGLGPAEEAVGKAFQAV